MGYDMRWLNTLDGVERTEEEKKNNYISNAVFLDEMKKSKRAGKLTKNAEKMIILLCIRLSEKLRYEDEEDRNDCIEFAILDCISYWENFNPDYINPDKPSLKPNPFAYFTSIATNGFAKGWRRMGKHMFPASIMTRLNGNIHSL